MSIEDSHQWGLDDDSNDSSRYPRIPASGRLSRLDEAGGLVSTSPEALVESGRFRMMDVMEPSIDFSVLPNEDTESKEEQPWKEDGDAGLMTLNWGENEKLEWWQEKVETQVHKIDPESGEILDCVDIDPNDLSDFSPAEIAKLSCEVSLWGEETIENEEQDEAEALEVERLLNLGELDNELE